MLKEIWKVKNGDFIQDYKIYTCDKCCKDIEEAWPFYKENENHYCVDCQFVRGKIGEREYLKNVGGGLDSLYNVHAGVYEDKAYIWTGSTAPWEPTLRQLRATPEYRQWRKAVMKKGKGFCASCKSQENLEAHHKKSFSKFPELRFDVKNGQVLCKECHDKKHAKKQKRMSRR